MKNAVLLELPVFADQRVPVSVVFFSSLIFFLPFLHFASLFFRRYFHSLLPLQKLSFVTLSSSFQHILSMYICLSFITRNHLVHYISDMDKKAYTFVLKNVSFASLICTIFLVWVCHLKNVVSLFICVDSMALMFISSTFGVHMPATLWLHAG